jgi:hypothetical protein
MVVVAGPPGSGKTRYFPVTALGVDAFNIDDRCAQILGSYRAIPRDVRRAVAKECERFVLDHIERRVSFAVETTLRTAAAIQRRRGSSPLRAAAASRDRARRPVGSKARSSSMASDAYHPVVIDPSKGTQTSATP